jgi:anti-sigma B factor antagonist
MAEYEQPVLIESAEDVSIVILYGSFDISNTLKMDQALRELIQNGAKKIILDLTHASYLVSTGFRAIINSKVRLNLVEGYLHVVSPPQSAVRRTFQLSRLDQIIALFDDRASALSAFP